MHVELDMDHGLESLCSSSSQQELRLPSHRHIATLNRKEELVYWNTSKLVIGMI